MLGSTQYCENTQGWTYILNIKKCVNQTGEYLCLQQSMWNIVLSIIFIWNKSVMWPLKVCQQFWALLKKVSVFRWLEEMHLSETASLIRLCLESVFGSGQQVLWGTSTAWSTSRVLGGELWWGKWEYDPDCLLRLNFNFSLLEEGASMKRVLKRVIVALFHISFILLIHPLIH